MKNILWFWCALLAFAFLSCSDNQDQLKSSIIKMNERCPVVEENWTVDSLGISKEGDIVYFCNSTNNADYMRMLKTNKDSIRNSIISKLNDESIENSMKLVKLCKKHNAGLVYKYYSDSTSETMVLKIPVEKLIADPSK